MMSANLRPSSLPAILLLGLIAATVMPTPSEAASVTVGPGGWCTFTNLGDAVAWVEAADDGPHTIEMMSGTYTVGWGLDIHEPMTITAGLSDCLDNLPDGPAAIFEIALSGAYLRIEGPSSGPRLRVVVENVRLVGDHSHASGLRIHGRSDVTLSRVGVEGMLRTGMNMLSSPLGDPLGRPSVTLNPAPGSTHTWSENDQPSSGGGAIYCREGFLSIHHTLFRSNSAWYNGGAIQADGCDVEIGDGVDFRDNHAGFIGGAIAAHYGSRVWTTGDFHSWGSSNTAPAGAFLSADASEITFRDSLVAGDPFVGGGTFYLSAGSHLDFYSTTTDCPQPQSGLCAYLGASESSDSGGALRLEDSSAWIHGAKIANASAEVSGAAVYVERSQLTLEKVIISGNSGPSILAVRGGEESSLALRYVTMSGNTADLAALVVESTGGSGPTVEILSSILWEPSIPVLLLTQGGAQAPDVHCLLASSTFPGSEVLIGEDPLFVNAPIDYHLTAASPAVDFCDGSRIASAHGDLDDELRGTDQPGIPDRGPGSYFDLGIDELFGGPTQILADGFESGDTSSWSSTVG